MLAAVDVGSNTLRLLLGEVRNGTVEPIRYVRQTTRLAGGLDPQTGLAGGSMANTLTALGNFAEMINALKIDRLRVVGTEALRRASNSHIFVSRVREITGLDLQIIEGEEEAALSCAGMLAALNPRPKHCLMFDIGGGSTEFILYFENRRIFQGSYPLGVVDLCEKYPTLRDQQKNIDNMLEQATADMRRSGAFDQVVAPETLLVGTAGTVTSLAAMKLQMEPYDGLRINNQCLEKKELLSMHEQLLPLSIQQREQLPGLEKNRGELILPGLRIVLAIFRHFSKKRMKVSDFGLLEGLLLQMAGHAVLCP